MGNKNELLSAFPLHYKEEEEEAREEGKKAATLKKGKGPTKE